VNDPGAPFLTSRKLARFAAQAEHACRIAAREGAIREACDVLLDAFLDISGAEYGFLGKRLTDPRGAPFLKTLAMTDIAWNAETAAMYEIHLDGGMEFRNLDTLFGRVLVSREPLWTDAPAAHPASGGLPEGHPTLDRFLGVPFGLPELGEGMLGAANLDERLTREEIRELCTILQVHGAQLLGAERHHGEIDRRDRERSNERYHLLERILGGFAHELNNETMVIGQCADLLADPDPAIDRMELRRDLSGSLGKINRMITDLRLFSGRRRSWQDCADLLQLGQRMTDLIALAPGRLDCRFDARRVELAVPDETVLAWLVESATMLTDSADRTAAVHLVADRESSRVAPCEVIIRFVPAGPVSAPSPARLGSLSGELGTWGARAGWVDDALELRVPARPI
jgi:signal transduction histidine kinase